MPQTADMDAEKSAQSTDTVPRHHRLAEELERERSELLHGVFQLALRQCKLLHRRIKR
jgi:hypothetical protein